MLFRVSAGILFIGGLPCGCPREDVVLNSEARALKHKLQPEFKTLMDLFLLISTILRSSRRCFSKPS